jgi:hypothetical protein
MDSTHSLPIDNLQLATVSHDGEVPKQRIPTAKAAIDVHTMLRRDDEASSRNRARIQAAVDGEPPYNRQRQRDSGQADACNVNFGEFADQLEKALAAYVDMGTSVERLITVRPTKGVASDRAKHGDIISEEFSRMVRSWPGFLQTYLYGCQQFVLHGVSVAYFDDNIDWRWRAAPFGEFHIPRGTAASQHSLPVASARRGYQMHEIYEFIEDEASATARGWNVEQVKKAIAGGSEETNTWEDMQAKLKNCDLTASKSEISLIHVWVKEASGGVTHMIVSDKASEEFLLVERNKFKTMQEAFVFFTFGIGTNGTFHSIRGIGHRLYAMIQFSNRLLSRVMDGAMVASSLLVQAESEEAADQMSLMNFGPFAVISPGMKLMERASPDLSRAVEPALQRLDGMTSRAAGRFTGGADAAGRDRVTRFELETQVEELAKLNSISLSLFYAPWETLLREVFRRTMRDDYVTVEPGGLEVAEFKRRCMDRGVPGEVLKSCNYKDVTAVRAIGAGSASARRMVVNELAGLAPQFDEEGRRNALRAQVGGLMGHDRVDEFVAPTEGPRPTIDDKMAELENLEMTTSGQEAQVFSTDLHPIHAQRHLAKLSEMVEALDQAQAKIEDLVPIMVPIHGHATKHVEQMLGPVLEAEAATYRQQLQQTGEIIYNGVKHIQKLQNQQQTAQPGADGQPTPEQVDQMEWSRNMERSVLEHKIKLQSLEETAAQKLRAAAAMNAQKIALEDLKAAAAIRRGTN